MDTTDRETAQAWLGLQCSMVAGVSRAIIIFDVKGSHGQKTEEAWPQNAVIPTEVQRAAQQAIAERRRVVDQMSPPDASAESAADIIIALPVTVGGKLVGAFAVEMTGRSEQKQRAALQVFAWGAAWLEILLRKQRDAAAGYLNMMLEVIAQAVAADSADACAIAVVNELARRLSCERVSIGFLDDHDIKIRAVSDATRIESKLALVRLITAAMHESLDQDRSIVVPATIATDGVVDGAHRSLINQTGERALCSIPLISRDHSVGAITLERDPENPFDEKTVEALETLTLILGSIVDDKLQGHKSWLTRSIHAGRGWLEKLLGTGHVILKAAALTSVALLLFISVVEVDYRVDAKARLEGQVQRAVVAPFDGFLAEAPARAGDIVEEGQLLCRLEDRDLRLESARWSGEKAQLLQAQREAMAKHERSELGILQARMEQAEAKLELVEEKLARTRLSAPLSGLVVTGDLSQSLGIPLERGQVLFEIAPLDSYRIMLEVDERDVGHIEAGQRGQLALSSLPHARQAFTVRRVLPVAAPMEGQNYFLVEAELDSINDQLRPGMRGVGKIETGSRKLVWIWSHRMVDWFSLSFWQWLR